MSFLEYFSYFVEQNSSQTKTFVFFFLDRVRLSVIAYVKKKRSSLSADIKKIA